jgi:hypothetical protein
MKIGKRVVGTNVMPDEKHAQGSAAHANAKARRDRAKKRLAELRRTAKVGDMASPIGAGAQFLTADRGMKAFRG